MDKVCWELDEVRAEVEKLKEECRAKTELVGSLKKASSEECLRLQEARQQTEKQAHELALKSEEISDLKKIHEDLKSRLHEKDMHIAQLSSENEKIQANYTNRLLKLEENNRELLLALDELTARYNYLEDNACASNKEISRLRTVLLATEKKYLEAEEKAKETRILRHRDDVILQLEEENRNVKDKIKWRNEQFKHLEEAHEKIQGKFRFSKEEWEKERSALLEEISSLQSCLDSQTRISEELQSRLEICNHALAHEESKRKRLEAEISEFKSCFEDVFTQCEERKSVIQDLTVQRNEEIAKLRNSLGEKEMLVRELEHKIVHLEQDNQELGDSLKELREAQIQNAGANSFASKLRNKLKRLEEVHKSCSSILKSKESQWGHQIEKMEADISALKCILTTKEQEIMDLQMELERCHFSIEENHTELLIFKSELVEACSKLLNAETDKAVHIKENEGMILYCAEKLGVEDNSLKAMAWQHFQLEEELERQKKMLVESSKGQLVLKEQLLQLENTLTYERSVLLEAIEKMKLEVANKNAKLSQLECEVQNWKSTAETLKVSYEEIQGACKKMETSLLSQIENEQVLKHENENLLYVVKDQEKKTEDLQLLVALLETKNAEKLKEVEACKQEKEILVQLAQEKDCCIKDLQKDIAIACMKQESMIKELEDAVLVQLDAEKALELEKEMALKIKDEKDKAIKHYQELATAMEQDFLDALCFSFSKQVEKCVEVSVLDEALKNAEYLTKLEIEEKNMRIMKSELEVNNLLENLANTEESLFHSKQEAKQLQASLEALKLETEKLTAEQRTMENTITELEFEKGNLLQDIMKLSTEREVMLVHIEEISGRIGDLSGEDFQLMESLGNIINTFVDENERATDSAVRDKLTDSTRNGENGFTTTKKFEENFDGRSPLREVNNLPM